MMAQIAAFTRIDLGARIIKVMVFDKRTELRRPIVVRACDDLPGEVRMIFPSARAEASIRAGEVYPGGFGIVNADACAGVGLKFAKCEAPNKIRHECSGVNKGSRACLSEYVPVCKPHGGVSATPEAIVKEVPFNGWTKCACAKDVTELNAPEKADVILRAKRESVSKLICKNPVTAPVLINVGPHVDRAIKAGAIEDRRRLRRDLLVFRRSGK